MSNSMIPFNGQGTYPNSQTTNPQTGQYPYPNAYQQSPAIPQPLQIDSPNTVVGCHNGLPITQAMNEYMYANQLDISEYHSRCQARVEEFRAKGIITLFAFEKSVPEEYRDCMTQLIITDVDDPILKKDLGTQSDYLLTAFRKYEEIPNKLRGYEWLYLSAAFLYPFLQRSGKAEAYPDIVKTAKLLAQEIEQLKDIESTVDMILEQLCDYFTHETLSITIEMKKDTRVDEQQLNSLVFLANPKIFISTAKYRELLKRTGIPVSYDAVNAVLKERDILVAGNGSTGFTSKMNYYNTEGHFKRHQMVLLDASKIEVDDGITLADKM